MSKYAIGLDYGTNSCRSLIVDLSNGNELASYVFPYSTGEQGIIVDSADYILGIEVTITEAIKKAKELNSEFDPKDIIGIGVDTTGSSPLPVDPEGMPLSYKEEFKDDKAAYVWLWKDHTAHEEAAEIRPQYLAKIGGVYSSEWFWSKILKCKRSSNQVFKDAYSFIEICDWISANLCGDLKPENIKRSICAVGHKAMFCDEWNGLPDKDFLSLLSPELVELRDRLYTKAYSAEEKLGNLSADWAEKLGLSRDVAISVGAFDAHMGAVGAEGDWKTSALVRAIKVMGSDLTGGTSFMGDYTYHLDPSGMKVLGAHMLEVCPSIAEGKPNLEVHPLGIGGKDDPARLVFDTAAGAEINVSLIDMGNRFRMVVNEVDVVKPDADFPNLPVARVMWEPKPNLQIGAAAWIHSGAAHHSGFSQSVTTEFIDDWCAIAGVEIVVIDADTKIRSFKQELLWNSVAYK
ncbi:MAG: hypothetical protein JEY94_06025 [Melioribacteraceae bacterium]|nr:hypothetical protein [Melioribacteraceae bacterium]